MTNYDRKYERPKDYKDYKEYDNYRSRGGDYDNHTKEYKYGGYSGYDRNKDYGNNNRNYRNRDYGRRKPFHRPYHHQSHRDYKRSPSHKASADKPSSHPHSEEIEGSEAPTKDQDAGHFEYKIGSKIGNYKIVSHLGDGTFGRTLKCQNLRDHAYYAVKIIRAVKRYNSSAKIEIKILNDVRSKGGNQQNLVLLNESFIHQEDSHAMHTCLVFETLGKSLYEFIKGNKYYGFSLKQIQSIAK